MSKSVRRYPNFIILIITEVHKYFFSLDKIKTWGWKWTTLKKQIHKEIDYAFSILFNLFDGQLVSDSVQK